MEHEVTNSPTNIHSQIAIALNGGALRDARLAYLMAKLVQQSPITGLR